MVESKRKDEYEVKIYKSFDDMPLKDDLLKGIYSTGFENPSIIQQKAIVPLIDKKDLIARFNSPISIWNWKNRNILYWSITACKSFFK